MGEGGGGEWQLKCEKFLTSYYLVLPLMITLLKNLCQQFSHCLPLGVFFRKGVGGGLEWCTFYFS